MVAEASVPNIALGEAYRVGKTLVPPRLRLIVFSTIYFAAMGYFVFLGFTQPYMNWDMLGYVGSVTEWSTSDPEQVYAKTMQAARKVSSISLFHAYLDNPLSARSDAFAQELPLYQVKPLYNALVWVVGHRVSLPAATWIVSASSFALLSVLLFAWYPHHMAREVWLTILVALAVLWRFPMSHLAQLSTPDCVAMLLQMAAIYAWMRRQSFILFALFCWLACLARPDALFLSLALAICFALQAQERAIPVLQTCGLVLVLVITCAAITHFSWYSYSQFFIHSYVDRRPFPGQLTEQLTLGRYWNTLASSCVLFVKAPRQIAMVVLSLFAGVCYCFKAAENRHNLLLLIAAWVALAVRFMLFPAWGDDRYYFTYWVPILFACGELMTPGASVLWKMQAHLLNIRSL